MVINKKGYALVEASLVMPLIILVIFSLIMLSVHYYRSGELQFANHKEAVKKSLEDVYLVDIRQFNESRNTNIDGILSGKKENVTRGTYYVINEVSILRVANEIDEILE